MQIAPRAGSYQSPKFCLATIDNFDDDNDDDDDDDVYFSIQTHVVSLNSFHSIFILKLNYIS